MLQLVADGLMLGATVSLGAIGLTLTYSILRFANFTHGEFITIGAYAALAALAGFAGVVADAGTFGELSFGWPLVVALLLAVLVTGGVAVLLDWLLFRRLRRHGSAIVMVIASFGASLALRNLITSASGRSPTTSPARCRCRSSSCPASASPPTSWWCWRSPPCWSPACMSS
jgi:branched-chain amino acid transport system permease protein